MMRGCNYTVHGLPAQPDTWFVMPDSPTPGRPGVVEVQDSGVKIPSKAPAALQLPPLQSMRLGQLHRTRMTPGTCSLWKVLKDTANNLVTSAQQVAGAFVGSMAASALTERVAGVTNPSDAYANSGISQALATSMSIAATGFLTSTVTSLRGARLRDIDALRETYSALIDHSQESIKHRPLPIQTAIVSLDKSVREAFSQNSQSVAWHEQKLRHREGILMSIPYYAKDIAQWRVGDQSASALQQKIQERIRELIDAYPVEMRASLENLIQRIRANSVAETPVRVQAYLYGPPGTGKTRFVKEVAKALGLPMIEIRLPAKQLETLYGYPYSVDFASANTSDGEIIGELAQKLIKSGYTNPIVFFDELTISNAQILNGLKLLLDRSKKEIRVASFDVELDWRRATVFCAGNDKLGHAALIKRMPQLDFLTVSADAKKQILLATYDAAMSTYKDALSAESIGALKTRYLDQHDFILEKDRAPGSRDLEIVAENLVHLLAGRLIQGVETSVVDIRQQIESDFRTMRLADQALEAVPLAEDAEAGSDADD